jgi:hypothetical protein
MCRRFRKRVSQGLKAALRVPDRQALVFDFGAAVHDNFHSKRLRPRRRRIVADAELHPDNFRPRIERKRFIDDSPGRCRVAENVHHVDGPRDIRQSLEKRRAVNALARKAWIDADHLVAARK